MAVIDHGSIVAEGTPEELKRSLGGDVIEIELRGATDAARAAALLGDGASADGDQVRLTARDASARIPEVVAGLQRHGLELEALSLARPTLDDVFLEPTGRRLERSVDVGPEEPAE